MSLHCIYFFFFNDTATTEIYTLSLHDALPICPPACRASSRSCTSNTCCRPCMQAGACAARAAISRATRSEEHTSELQSRLHLVCRLLLEKKKHNKPPQHQPPNPQRNTHPALTP